ncbi:MAG TPA: PVC-type heme-binding CxxCH protein [Lacipirellulaceae bacterium]|nr:PVC-type heme-binding CxxCH protein [Lacipirellulaceae bacterium]
MRFQLVQLLMMVAIGAAGGRIAYPQGFSPEEAARRMTLAKGLKVTLFAGEPMVRQSIFVKCDDRGRVWTIQYLQYPNPAGLKRVKVDRWSRTVYDRVPKPPPFGPRGADRITILEDTDGDGHADKAKDFVNGLNLVTGVEFGHGGVYVLNAPYLLFYPDANHDDVPDGNPQVLLSGFGMEDAQSMSNHLTWGPDGWLYGVNGSTTTCHIRGLEFQQGVWRFNPVSHEFEMFCEGGSNCYGVTFDANGELFYSTNGGPFVHAVQGGYFYKSFGKHGPLHNLHAYHYFPELERDQVPGGPPTGGTIYLADAFPSRFRGSFIAGNFLGHTVSWWTVEPTGSTFRAHYGGVLADSRDTWCGPTDVCMGPDGAIYFSDFYDKRTAHPDPDANWDRSNGRIYKITAKDAQRPPHTDVAALSSNQLVDLLSNSNQWYAYRARAELAQRRDPTIVDRLRRMATQTSDNQLALEGLWALNVTAGIDDSLAIKLLDHPYPYVRYWTIRLIGDRKQVSPEIANRLVRLATSEPSPVVRAQLAASAKRLPANDDLRIVESLLRSRPNETDQRIPWLVWWAVESKAMSDTSAVVSTFSQESLWSNPAARADILLLVRRYAAEGTADAYDACARLLRSAPAQYAQLTSAPLREGLAERAVGLQGIGQGALFGKEAAATGGKAPAAVRQFEPVRGNLKDYISRLWREKPSDSTALELALRAGADGAYAALKAATFAPSVPPTQREDLLLLLREFGRPDAVGPTLQILRDKQPDSVKLAAIDVLSADENPEITAAFINLYRVASPQERRRIRDVLFSRPAPSIAFLKAIDAHRIKPDDIPLDQLRRLALHKNDQIDNLVRKYWGNIGPGSSEEKLATMRRFNNDLRAGTGDSVKGKVLFMKTCGVCHTLFGEGAKIGPNLTFANRGDRDALLANIVDPSAVIRREFMNYIVTTTSGRVLTGLIAEQDAASITILDAENHRTKLPRSEVDELREAGVSLMPERLLEKFTPQERRDLFAYLQSSGPPKKDEHAKLSSRR